ncbi:CSF2R factor, partial [Pomatorhinus ruficollis]|nr:CSF2R factor [Pomatorhinus ruficollis]
PLNVSVNCTEASHRCSISWQPPRTSDKKKSSCFKYEIFIENKEAIVENNSYLYESFSSGKRYSVKIRATDAGLCLLSSNWGEWSTPVEFGSRLTFTSPYTLFVVPGLATGLVLLLCMTVGAYLKKTSATIPQPRDPFHESSPMDFQAEYMNLLKNQETEEIIDVKEVMECK